MDIRKDNGVSPVIATVLLIALSVVLIALIAAVIMAGVSSFTPVENKVVGFTVEVNATNNTALVTPVSGTDRPFMESYRVYTNNGHWDSSDAGELTVPEFNSTVTYVNIVGNFTDHVTALVFSGKVVVEGGVIVVNPIHGGYYVVGSEVYPNVTAFVNSFNEWYNTYYETGYGPGDAEYYVVTVETNRKDFTFSNEYPIIVGDQPIEFSTYNMGNLNNGNVNILIDAPGNFERAPGYADALIQIGNASDFWTTQFTLNQFSSDPLTLNGNNIDGVSSALLVITSKGSLSVPNGETLIVENNLNVNGDGLGGGIYIENGGKLDVKGSLIVNSNAAKYGGGIYVVNYKKQNFGDEDKINYFNNTALLDPATNNVFKG